MADDLVTEQWQIKLNRKEEQLKRKRESEKATLQAVSELGTLIVEAERIHGLIISKLYSIQATTAKNSLCAERVVKLFDTLSKTMDIKIMQKGVELTHKEKKNGDAVLKSSHPIVIMADLPNTPVDLGFGSEAIVSFDFVGRKLVEWELIGPHPSWKSPDIPLQAWLEITSIQEPRFWKRAYSFSFQGSMSHLWNYKGKPSGENIMWNSSDRPFPQVSTEKGILSWTCNWARPVVFRFAVKLAVKDDVWKAKMDSFGLGQLDQPVAYSQSFYLMEGAQ